MKWWRALPATFLSLVIVTFAAQAQDICPGAVYEALERMGANCDGINRNNACYGYDNVQGIFNAPVDPETFDEEAERADLIDLATVITAPLNLQTGEWGVSLLSVQANLPDALPGQVISFVMFGGVEVEGGVYPEDAVIADRALDVQVVADAEMRIWSDSDVVGTVSAGTTVSADAISPDGQWVRILNGSLPGWVMRSALDPNVDLTTLTVVTRETMTPMQAFFFRVGIGGIECDQVPSALAIQGPRDIAVDFRMNGVDVRVTSTVVVTTHPPGDLLGDYMELMTLSGMAILYPDTPQEILVPPGFVTRISFVSTPASLGIEGDVDEKAVTGQWSTPRPATPEELTQYELFEFVPTNVLSYPITIPIVVQASGRTVITQLVFPDPRALDQAREACAAGLLAPDICAYLGIG